VDREEIIRAIQAVATVTGRRPRWSDFHPRRLELPGYQKIISIFGSFNAALESAGIPPRTHVWTRAEVIAALRRWSRGHGRPPTANDWRLTGADRPGANAVADLFGGWSQALSEANLRQEWHPEEILTALQDWRSQHGRPPTSRGWQTRDPSGTRPTTQEVRTRFGSWSAALEASGLRPARNPGRGGRVVLLSG
jgi:Homing endonuclease associated repeat